MWANRFVLEPTTHLFVELRIVRFVTSLLKIKRAGQKKINIQSCLKTLLYAFIQEIRMLFILFNVNTNYICVLYGLMFLWTESWLQQTDLKHV